MEIRDRPLLVAEPHLGLAAIVPRIGIGRVVLQRLVVIGKAAFVVALVEPDHTAIAPATRDGRPDPGRFAVIGSRAVKLLGVLPIACSFRSGPKASHDPDRHIRQAFQLA